jgi:hypothetical protein
MAGNRKALFIDELRRRSSARIGHAPLLQDIAKDAQELNERLKNNRLSLNEPVRRAEMARDAKQRAAEEAERKKEERTDLSMIYELSLADVRKPELPPLGKTRAAAKPALRGDNPVAAALGESEDNSRDEGDPVKREALSILSDVIDLSKKDAGEPRAK